jgi:hypothetical protein
MNEENIIRGYMILPIIPEQQYRGVDRWPFHAAILPENDDWDSKAFRRKPNYIWEWYLPGWRRDAYRIFEENLVPIPTQVNEFWNMEIVSNLTAAEKIQQIIEPHIGNHEIVFCEVFEVGAKGPGQIPERGKWLGYDTAYSGGDFYSAVKNGLFYHPDSEFVSAYISLLNEFGLFNDVTVIKPYIDHFKEVALSESNSIFVVYRLYLIMKNKNNET